MNPNTKEHNILIAKYMKCKPTVRKNDGFFEGRKTTSYLVELNDGERIDKYDFALLYHESYDWIVPVVRKCLSEKNSLHFDTYFNVQQAKIELKGALASCNIEILHLTLVNFIKLINCRVL